MKIFAAVSLLCITAVASARADTPASVNRQLLDALTCKGDSMAILRSMAARRDALASVGVTIAANNGEGYDEVIDVTPAEPIRLGAATAAKATLAFEGPYDGFAGLVFAEFNGDPAAMVTHLGLVPGTTAPYAIARYVSRDARGADCPAHVGMAVLDKDRFVLGCGWCNGG